VKARPIGDQYQQSASSVFADRDRASCRGQSRRNHSLLRIMPSSLVASATVFEIVPYLRTLV
jgi:hypothetical protein